MNSLNILNRKNLVFVLCCFLLLGISVPGRFLVDHFFDYSVESLAGISVLCIDILPYLVKKSSLLYLLVPSIVLVSFFPIIFFTYGVRKVNHKNFSRNFFYLTTSIALLDVWHFCRGWAYGLTWQGKNCLYLFILENLMFFLLIYGLCYFNKITHNRNFLYIAVFVFSVMLSCIAFPLLGESL